MIINQEREKIEAVIIHTCLSENNFYFSCNELKVDHNSFISQDAQFCFEAIEKYQSKNLKIPDVVELWSFMGEDHKYLQSIVTKSKPDLEKAQTLIKAIVEDNAEREARAIIKGDSRSIGWDYVAELQEKLTGVINKFFGHIKKQLSNSDIAENVLLNIRATKEKKRSDYIPTLIEGLDRAIIGIHRKSLTIIAARPAMGKTALMLQLKRNFIKQGYKVGIFSLEMDAESLFIRDLADKTNIDSLDIESGNINQEMFEKIKSKAIEIYTSDYVMDDNAHQTIETIKAKINDWRINNKADVVMLDYLTLIQFNKRARRTDLEVGDITAELREFSKEYKIPIIILSQLNRLVESRADKRPMLQDLRESGNIEQDARVVLFLYRPDEYGIPPQCGGLYTKEGYDVEKSEYTEIIIAKARHGRVGVVPLRYIKKYHRFENLSNSREPKVPVQIYEDEII